MTTPTRDEIAMALLRATDRFEAGQEDLPTNEYDMKMLLAGILADAVLALMASKREAEPDVRMFGPIGTHPAPQTPVVVPLWRYPQTAEPDAWMATTTGSQPKEGDEHE